MKGADPAILLKDVADQLGLTLNLPSYLPQEVQWSLLRRIMFGTYHLPYTSQFACKASLGPFPSISSPLLTYPHIHTYYRALDEIPSEIRSCECLG